MPGRRGRWRVSAIDQHVIKGLNLKGMVADLCNGEAGPVDNVNLPEGVTKESDWYTCLLCCTKAKSRSQLDMHLGGKRHRYIVLHAALKRHRDFLVSNKNNVDIKCEYDVENPQGYIKLHAEGSKMDIVLEIHNNHDSESVSLDRCEKLRPFNSFQVDAKYKSESHTIGPGCSLQVVIHFCGRASGHHVTPIALFFSSKSKTQHFCIVRCLHAVCSNKFIQDLLPVSPFRSPPHVSHQPVKNRTVDGYHLPSTSANQLEVEIPLMAYEVPSSLRDGLKHGNQQENGGLFKDKRDILACDLKMKTYKRKFSLLLHVEEMQMEVDIRKYDMENVTITKCKQNQHLLVLQVPGLIEKRPCVLKGDWLFAWITGGESNIEYKGYVHRVCRDEVWLGFADVLIKRFLPGMKFSIRFVVNRLPARMQHRAVMLAEEHSLSPLLFPSAESSSQQLHIQQLSHNIRWHDKNLASNQQQVTAVKHIVDGTSRPSPYLIFGPPGTGKTVTIVEAMKQVYKLLPESHILACTPSNSAANLIVERLMKHVESRHIIRLNGFSQQIDNVPQSIWKCCNFKDGDVFFPPKKELLKYRVIVCTLVTAGRLVSANFPQGHFTHVFIDEAGQAIEPECIIPLAGIIDNDKHVINGGQVVLAGDPEQLGPILRSPIAIQFGLDISLLERLMKKCELYQRNRDASCVEEAYNNQMITKLVRNYRSHPAIIKVPNDLFYNDELIPCADEFLRESLCNWDELPGKNFPLIFHGVTGEEMREEMSPSFFNPYEVKWVWHYVEKLMEMKSKLVKQKDIGIITPYHKQVQKVRKVLRKKYPDITVGSVEEFQGQERLVIIISTVRSNPAYLGLDVKCQMGFVKSPKRFNVAITRAKALLIVIGNPHILCTDHHWNSLLAYCQKNGAYTGCEFEMDDAQLMDSIKTLDDITKQPANQASAT